MVAHATTSQRARRRRGAGLARKCRLRAGDTAPGAVGGAAVRVSSRSASARPTRGGSTASTRELPAGGLTVVAGPSGSGKSTLLRLCNRLEVPSEGPCATAARTSRERDPLTLRRAVAMVFQRPVTFAGTVLDNLREADRDCDEARGAELLERAGLPASLPRSATPASCQAARHSGPAWPGRWPPTRA